MGQILDQMNREVSYPDNIKRIVSLVPSQTELLVDLGLQDALVGLTKFCVHPEGLRKEKKVVGGTKMIHFDRIKELRPDIILCNKEENTKEMVEELEKIAPVHVSDVEDMDGSLEMIGQYGTIFQVEEKASEIQGEIARKRADFQEFIRQQPKRKVAYLIWKKPWMVAGKDTFIDYLLRLNNFENVYLEEDSRYPEIELSSIPEKGVDLVLLSTEPFPFQKKHKDSLQGKLPLQRIEIVDGEFYSWYGSRLTKAFGYFKQFHLSLQTS